MTRVLELECSPHSLQFFRSCTRPYYADRMNVFLSLQSGSGGYAGDQHGLLCGVHVGRGTVQPAQ